MAPDSQRPNDTHMLWCRPPLGLLERLLFEAVEDPNTTCGLAVVIRLAYEQVTRPFDDRRLAQATTLRCRRVKAMCCVAAHRDPILVLKELVGSRTSGTTDTEHLRLIAAMGAAYENDASLLSALVAEGVNVDANVEFFGNLLITAARWGSLAAAEVITSPRPEKREVHTDRTGKNALDWAAANGHVALVKLLLDLGIFDSSQYTYISTADPWTLAAKGGHVAVMRLLLGSRFTQDRDMSRLNLALVEAVKANRIAVVEHLLAHDQVYLNPHNNFPQNVLVFPANSGDEAMFKLLFTRGKLHPTAPSGMQHVFIEAARAGHRNIMRILLEKRGHIDVSANGRCRLLGFTRGPALLEAAMMGRENVVRWLLQRSDVNVNCRDSGGHTPMFHAVKEGHCAVVRLLLGRKDVDVNFPDIWGGTPLAWASVMMNHNVRSTLLQKRGCEIDLESTRRGIQIICKRALGYCD